MYENGKYTELTVVSSKTKYQVHKAIVCLKSEFFTKAVNRRSRYSKPVAIITALTIALGISYLNVCRSQKRVLLTFLKKTPPAVEVMMHYLLFNVSTSI